jgi:addiction module RelE/StbE family toxin
MKLRVTKTATRDLTDIWHYLADDSVEAADKVIDAIRAAIAKIVEMPNIGHPRADIAISSYRFWRVYSYLIAYRMHGETLVISRVIHGRRDLSKLFKPRNP